ncbi:MAG TPA: EF-hand domain-containing protein, partial [Novosphingobium sp.]|nr:EF-hand domain-containing protein [Novosphingobium sp.]
GDGLIGADLPQASEATREERRFNRLDRNRDSLISRSEALSPRVAAFRKLDTDGNNLLSFEEWAVATSNRFKGADANGDGQLTRPEFATTKPKPAKKPACRC